MINIPTYSGYIYIVQITEQGGIMQTKITLYDECIINSGYKDIFRTTYLLDDYLNSLSKTTLSLGSGKSLNIEYKGEITTEISDSQFLWAFNKNYMKIEFKDTFTSDDIYAFIDDIYTRGNILHIQYTMDVYHTFSILVGVGNDPMWRIKTGYLSNCLRIDEYDISRYELPKQPIQNAPYIMQDFNRDSQYANPNKTKVDEYSSYRGFFYLFLVIGIRRSALISSAITPEEKYICRVFLGSDNTTSSIGTFTQPQIIEVLNRLTVRQSSHIIDSTSYFKIYKSYVVSTQFQINNIVGGSNTRAFMDEIRYDDRYIHLRYNNITYDQSNEYSIYYGCIKNSFNIFALGFRNNKYYINNNGIEHKFTITCIKAIDELHFYISIDGDRKEITESFSMDLLFNIPSGEELANRKINYTLNSELNENYKNKAKVDTAIGAVQFVGGLGSMAIGAGLGSASIAMRGANMTLGGISSMNSGLTEIDAANSKQKAIDNQQYNNITSVNTNAIAINDQYTGVQIMLIDEDYSDYDEVLRTKDELGYSVNHIIDEIKPSISYDYDILKFSYIRVMGLSTLYNSIIENIFKNGTKIWYTSNPYTSSDD